MNGRISSAQFSVFRFLFGAWLVFQFSAWLVYAEPLLGRPLEGSFFPSIFYLRFPFSGALFLLFACAGAGLLALGWQRRWVSAVLLYVIASAVSFNRLLVNPALSMTVGVLIVFIALPSGEAFAVGRQPNNQAIIQPSWTSVPAWALGAFWALLAGPFLLNVFSPGGLVLAPWTNAIGPNLKEFYLGLCLLGSLWVPLSFRKHPLRLGAAVCFALLIALTGCYGIFLQILILLLLWEPAWLYRARPVKPIVFFDGDCVLCNHSVDVLFQLDLEQRFQVAPLQSEIATRYLPPSESDSIRVWDAGRVYERSDAIVRIAWVLGGVWRIGGLIWFVPPFIRDALYDQIARHRIAWFGKRAFCRVASPDDRARFAE